MSGNDEMNGSEYNQLLEKALCGRLTPEEQARLDAHFLLNPEAQMDWEDEMALNGAIDKLPHAPLASNFTSQVMQAVAREEKRREASAAVPWWRWLFSPAHIRGMAVASVCLCAGLLAYNYSQESHREQVAQSLVKLTNVASIPSVEALKDFEAINRLSQVPPTVDVDLLAAAQ